MIEIKGKYNEAKIFTDVVDSASIAQVQELCNQEFAAGSRIRLMPDIHAGAGCTIGTTMTITDRVVPNLVGVDIGCGMETTRIREGRLELQKLDKLIYEKIPSGFSIRDKAHRYLSQIDLSELCCARHVDLLRAEKSIGTLGGGNHFIEVDKDDEGNLYIVVHSGSRHLGVEVAAYYQEAGYKVLNRTDDASLQALVAQMKAEGREKEIQKELKKLKNLKQTSIPKALAYVSGELFEQYIHDMKIVQHFAMLNRQAMMDEIVKGMKLHNEKVYYIIDSIQTAILDQHQISFQYYEYTPEKKKILKHDGYRYILDPYALEWKNDHYYLIGYSHKHKGIAHFRVDRLTSVEPLDSKFQPMPDFDVAAYTNKMVDMFAAEHAEQVKLLCSNELMRVIIDHYGEDIEISPYDDTHFTVIIEVNPSGTFYGWVFKFMGKIRILSPQSCVDKMQDIARTFI